MDLFFTLDRDDADPLKIIIAETEHVLNPAITNTYNAVRLSLSRSTDPDIKYVVDRYYEIYVEDEYYLWSMLNFDIENSYNILSDDFEDDFYITRVIHKGSGTAKIDLIENTKVKYKNMVYNMQSPSIFAKVAKMDRCTREMALFRNKVHIIAYLFDFLEIDGSFYIEVHGFCDDRVLELYYILSIMFRRCVIYNTYGILCTEFDPRDNILKTDVLKLLDDQYIVSPKPRLAKFVEYIHNNLAYQTHKFRSLLDHDENAYHEIMMNEVINSIKYTKNNEEVLKFMIHYNKSIIENLKRVLIEGRLTKVNSAINGAEGRFISDIIKKYRAVNCMEIGMAHGISAFYMLLNPDVRLVSIDPFQSTQWHNYGVKLLAEVGFDKRHRLYLDKSYVALPQILAEMGPGVFDFVFIDGFHTFDYTLLDFFYSNLLTKVGGIIVIDDALHVGVAKCVKYIDTNYSFFKKLVSPSTMAVYLKMREDKRDWNYHQRF